MHVLLVCDNNSFMRIRVAYIRSGYFSYHFYFNYKCYYTGALKRRSIVSETCPMVSGARRGANDRSMEQRWAEQRCDRRRDNGRPEGGVDGTHEINPSSKRYQCIFQQNGRAAATAEAVKHAVAAAGSRHRLGNAWRPRMPTPAGWYAVSSRAANSYETLMDADDIFPLNVLMRHYHVPALQRQQNSSDLARNFSTSGLAARGPLTLVYAVFRPVWPPYGPWWQGDRSKRSRSSTEYYFQFGKMTSKNYSLHSRSVLVYAATA